MAEVLFEIGLKLLLAVLLLPLFLIMATPIVFGASLFGSLRYWQNVSQGYYVTYQVWLGIAEQMA